MNSLGMAMLGMAMMGTGAGLLIYTARLMFKKKPECNCDD